MMIQTKVGMPIDRDALKNYFDSLVGMLFKILPLWEDEGQPLIYMQSLRGELLGCKELIVAVECDALMVRLISILQYMIDHPALELQVVRREVFHSISVCNQLKTWYAELQEEVV